MIARPRIFSIALILCEACTCATGAGPSDGHGLQLNPRGVLKNEKAEFVFTKLYERVPGVSSCLGDVLCGFQFYEDPHEGTYSFSRNVFFTLAEPAISQSDGVPPGTVVLAIMTSGVKKWFSTNTAALLSPIGQACVVDEGVGASVITQNAESTVYTIVDGTHVRLSLRRPHISGATLTVGENGCQFEPSAP